MVGGAAGGGKGEVIQTVLPLTARRDATDTERLRMALALAGPRGLTRMDMNNAVQSPNTDRRFREMQEAGEAEKYPAGRTERGRTLFRYRLRNGTQPTNQGDMT